MAIDNPEQRLAPDRPMATLVEEVATVSTRDVLTGRVRVSTTVDRFEEMVQSALQSETVEVTRVPINQMVEAAPQIRTEGDLTIIPVVEEVLVVEKRLMLKEEVRIRRIVTTETVSEPVSLRRQRAVVEHLDQEGAQTDGHR